MQVLHRCYAIFTVNELPFWTTANMVIALIITDNRVLTIPGAPQYLFNNRGQMFALNSSTSRNNFNNLFLKYHNIQATNF